MSRMKTIGDSFLSAGSYFLAGSSIRNTIEYCSREVCYSGSFYKASELPYGDMGMAALGLVFGTYFAYETLSSIKKEEDAVRRL